MVERAIARINETRFEQKQSLGINVPLDTGYNYSYPASVTIQVSALKLLLLAGHYVRD
jgi:hypothetical protein